MPLNFGKTPKPPNNSSNTRRVKNLNTGNYEIVVTRGSATTKRNNSVILKKPVRNLKKGNARSKIKPRGRSLSQRGLKHPVSIQPSNNTTLTRTQKVIVAPRTIRLNNSVRNKVIASRKLKYLIREVPNIEEVWKMIKLNPLLLMEISEKQSDQLLMKGYDIGGVLNKFTNWQINRVKKLGGGKKS
jgi:hypothetical protein